MAGIPASSWALFEACWAGDAAVVSKLLPAGGPPLLDLNGADFRHPQDQSTPLLVAAEDGNTAGGLHSSTSQLNLSRCGHCNRFTTTAYCIHHKVLTLSR
jgi:hypothetical protein